MRATYMYDADDILAVISKGLAVISAEALALKLWPVLGGQSFSVSAARGGASLTVPGTEGTMSGRTGGQFEGGAE